ncbi:hypothetical protein ACIA98_06725 [Streptomyces sp. NPDC051366]|uniref:hypothetical protein n=1 Tax=Streptomyces sp. NPDC051366 TaxID=3365652 RepID=UPI0037A0CBF2
MSTSSNRMPVIVCLIIATLASAVIALASALLVFVQGGNGRDATNAGGGAFAVSMAIGIAAIGLLRD